MAALLTEAELKAGGVGPATVADWLEHGLLSRAADGTFDPTPVALELMAALSVRSTTGGYKTPRRAKPPGPRRVSAPRRPHLIAPPQPASTAERKRAAAALSSSSPYRTLAMPPAWLPVLTPLPVPLGRLRWTRLPKLEELERALAQLDGRELEVLRGRERGQVLSEVGASFGLTRERIRQLEADALRALRSGGAVGRVEQQLAPLSGQLVRAVRGDKAEADGLRLAVFLTGRGSGRGLRLATVGPARWLVVDAEQHAAAERALAALLMRERFVAAPRLAAALGLSEDELAVLPSLFPGRYLFLPAGLVALGGGSRSPQDFEGVVRLLSAAGFRQWHLSQLAKAVQLVRGDPGAPAVHAVWSHLRRLVETGEVKAVGRSGLWRVGASRRGLSSRPLR